MVSYTHDGNVGGCSSLFCLAHAVVFGVDDFGYVYKRQRYIRASLYFRLTNLYVAVPFFTEDITLEESRSVSRTDRETIISFIHQELEDIKDALPTRDQLPEEDKGKITKGAVCALQRCV